MVSLAHAGQDGVERFRFLSRCAVCFLGSSKTPKSTEHLFHLAPDLSGNLRALAAAYLGRACSFGYSLGSFV